MTLDPQQPIDLALKAGASHAEVYQSQSQSRPVFFEANRLKQLESSQAEGTALRLWCDSRPGLAVAYGDIDPQTLVEKAIALSALNQPEAIELSEPRTEIHPLQGEEIPVEKLIELGEWAIATLCEDFPDVICGGEFSCEQTATRLINSQGLHCEYSERTHSYYLGLEWIRDEDFLAVYDGETTRGAWDLAPVLARLRQRLQWAAVNVEPLHGRLPVILTPNAASLLWETVDAALNGKNAVEKSSPWSDRLDALVSVGGLTLSQQPDLPPYDCPFDDEATPTRTLTFIESGRLMQFYCDRRIAKLLGCPPTGNGFRAGLGSYPSPDSVNLVVEPRSGSLADFIQNLDRGLVVDQILGGGADISGDFSINVDLGYRIEGGQIAGRVKDTMVAGNVYSALQELVEIGCDRQWSGAYFTPSLQIESLSVAG